MAKYRNTRTGAEIDVTFPVRGNEWELVQASTVSAADPGATATVGSPAGSPDDTATAASAAAEPAAKAPTKKPPAKKSASKSGKKK